MKEFKIRLIAEDEVKELIAIANNFTDLQKLLKSRYSLDDYLAITHKNQTKAQLMKYRPDILFSGGILSVRLLPYPSAHRPVLRESLPTPAFQMQCPFFL